MLICVTSSGDGLDSAVDPRFGRAENFLIYDTDTKQMEVLPNEQNLSAAQGAGIQAATTVAGAKVAAVITGNCGPKAFRVLDAAGISVYIGLNDRTVREAIDDLVSGKVQPANQANVEGHWV